MQYYDPNDRKPRLWAVVVTLLYAVLIGVSFAFVSFDFRRIEEKVGDEVARMRCRISLKSVICFLIVQNTQTQTAKLIKISQ